MSTAEEPMGPAARRWRDQLLAWAIPPEILAAVDDSPWVVPTDIFARRADASVAAPQGASYRIAREALSEGMLGAESRRGEVRRGGALHERPTVLDVGSGAGAASLPLGRPITAVDVSAEMLAALATRAQRLGLPVTTLEGRWPDIATQAPVADVVVCHHVAYNVPELGAFAIALTEHARRRVVLELTANHPMAALNPLWTEMHGITRPSGPTAWDAVEVLREVGISASVETGPRPPRPEYSTFDDLVEITRRRVCVPPGRAAELAEALLRLGIDPEHPRDLSRAQDTLVTLWWSPGA